MLWEAFFLIEMITLFAKDKYKIIDWENASLLPECLMTAVASYLCFQYFRTILYTYVCIWSETYNRKGKVIFFFFKLKANTGSTTSGQRSGKLIIDILTLEFGKRRGVVEQPFRKIVAKAKTKTSVMRVLITVNNITQHASLCRGEASFQMYVL